MKTNNSHHHPNTRKNKQHRSAPCNKSRNHHKKPRVVTVGTQGFHPCESITNIFGHCTSSRNKSNKSRKHHKNPGVVLGNPGTQSYSPCDFVMNAFSLCILVKNLTPSLCYSPCIFSHFHNTNSHKKRHIILGNTGAQGFQGILGSQGSSGGSGIGTATYSISGLETVVTQTSYLNLGYFSWDNTRYSSYTNGTIIFNTLIVDRNFDIQLVDSSNNILGGPINISTSDTQTLGFVNPVGNNRIAIQVKKSAAGGTNPRIFGTSMEFLV